MNHTLWMRNEYKNLVSKPKVKRRIDKPRNQWDKNIKGDMKGILCEGLDCSELAYFCVHN
jgi:hypothetical protein